MTIIGKNKHKIQFKKIDNIMEFENLKNICFDLDFWKEHRNRIISSKKYIGIIINAELSLEELNLNYKLFDLIKIKFDTFKNGRGFTLARKLREDYKFKKDIRATGHILPDQYHFMIRCGFSSFEIKTSEKEIWENVIKYSITSHYQQTNFD